MCYLYSIDGHKLQLALAAQEQVAAAVAPTSNVANPLPTSTATVASNLTQTSVSQSPSQPQLVPPSIVSAVHLQQLQNQMNGQIRPAAALPYGIPAATGYPLPSPYGMVAAAPYDPKAMFAANKLKMLPKMDKRFAPY